MIHSGYAICESWVWLQDIGTSNVIQLCIIHPSYRVVATTNKIVEQCFSRVVAPHHITRSRCTRSLNPRSNKNTLKGDWACFMFRARALSLYLGIGTAPLNVGLSNYQAMRSRKSRVWWCRTTILLACLSYQERCRRCAPGPPREHGAVQRRDLGRPLVGGPLLEGCVESG